MNTPTIQAKDGTPLDPSVVALAKSIRKVESGGKYDVAGGSGEYGAYQYTPDTWKADAKKYLGDENADIKDPVNQDKVAYHSILEKKQAGYTPEQISSIWNSGKPDPTGNVGTNKYGVKYDTPSYVNNVIGEYQKEKQAYLSGNPNYVPQQQPSGVVPHADAATQPDNNQSSPEAAPSQLKTNVLTGQQYDPNGKDATFVKNLLGVFTKPISQAIGSIGHYVGADDGKTTGIDPISGLPYDVIGYRNGEKLSGKDTALQAGGNLLENAATFYTGGLGNTLFKGTKLLPTIGRGLVGGAAVGGAQGLGSSLEQGVDAGEATANTLEGAGVGGLLGGATAGTIRGVKNVITPAIVKDEAKAADIITKRKAELQKLEDSYSTVRKTTNNAKTKGIDSKDLLAQTDLLHGAVDENGTIRTQNAMQQLNDFIKPQENVISQNLAREGVSLPLTTVETALKDSVKKSGLKGGALTRALKNVEDDIAGYKLEADAQGNIPLSTVHEAKVDKYANINYLNPESKRADKAIARGLKDLVEKNTKSVDVQKLNQELSSHYSVLSLLEKLDGKKVEGGKLGKYFAETVGGMVGSHFGALGTIIGAEVAGKVKGVQMASKFGGKTGKGLEQSETMQKAIAQGQTPKAPLLQLPAPSSEFRSQQVSGAPIPLGQKTQTTADQEMMQKFGTPQSVNVGNRNTIQSNTTAATNSSIPPVYNEPYVNPSELPVIDAGKPAKETTKSIQIDKLKPPNVAHGLLPLGGLGGLLSSKPEKYYNPEIYNDDGTKKVFDVSSPNRNLTLKYDDMDTLRGTLFAELSNEKNQQKDEARKIVNTALNRLNQTKTGGLKEILTAKNQYQGYGSKEYQRYEKGSLNDLDNQKLKVIDEVLAELQSGKFPDNTNGAVFYSHEKKNGKPLIKLGGNKLIK